MTGSFDPWRSGDRRKRRSPSAFSGSVLSGPPEVYSAGIATQTNAQTDPFSVSIDCGTNDNRMLLVFISYWTDNIVSLSSVNFNSSPMTHIVTVGSGVVFRCHVYGMIAPPTGSSTLDVDMSGNPETGPVITGVPLYNVNQTSVANAIRSTGTDPSEATSTTFDLTSSSVNDLCIGCAGDDDINGITSGGSQSRLHYAIRDSGSDNMAHAIDSLPGSAGTVTFSWSAQLFGVAVGVSVKGAGES